MVDVFDLPLSFLVVFLGVSLFPIAEIVLAEIVLARRDDFCKRSRTSILQDSDSSGSRIVLAEFTPFAEAVDSCSQEILFPALGFELPSIPSLMALF
jgi:hypothetical protein